MGQREGFCFGQRIRKADPVGAGKQRVCWVWLTCSPSLSTPGLPWSHLWIAVSLVLISSVWQVLPPQGSTGAPLWHSHCNRLTSTTRAWPCLTTSQCGPEGRVCSLRLSQADQEVTMSFQGRAHAEQPGESSCNETQRVMSPEHC